MQVARDKQAEEIEKQNEELAKEQNRMERMHIATMVMSGIVSNSDLTNNEEEPRTYAEVSIRFADALLEQLKK